MATNLDWIRDPPPSNITEYQKVFRDVGWINTALGSMESCLLYWGPERVILYNEACLPMVGEKHPAMLGMKARDAYPQFWDYFESIIKQQLSTGRAYSGKASRLLVHRHGFLEETYFDWKLIPVIGDEGSLVGVQGTPMDMTNSIIGTRRNLCIQHLSQRLVTATTMDDFATATMQGIAENEKDTPFAILYSQKHATEDSPIASTRYHSIGWYNIPLTHPLRKHEIYLNQVCGTKDTLINLICRAVESDKIVVFDDEPEDVLESFRGLDCQATEAPSKQFAAVPVRNNSGTPAVLVVGLNPHRRYNDWYDTYLRMIADALSSQLSKIGLSEKIQYHADLANRALKNFENSESRFSRFAQHSIMGLVITDMQGMILYANEAWCSFSGAKQDELEDTNWEDTVNRDDLPTLREWWHKVSVLKQNSCFQFRSTKPFKSGRMELPFRTGICAAYTDEDQDGVQTVTGLVVDISEQKWIEGQLLHRTRELEASEEKYRLFAEQSPLGIVRTDKNGRVIFGNAAWHECYNFGEEEMLDPQPWLKHVMPDDVPKGVEFFNTLASQRGTKTVEMRLKRKYTITEGDRVIEGDACVLASGLAEWNDEGEIRHIDFWVTDISAQKMAESILKDKMEEAIRTRTQQERFIDMISHEIRNPLSAVLHCGEEIVESMKSCLLTLDARMTPVDLQAKRDPDAEVIEKMIHNALDAGNTIMYCVQHQKQIVDDVLTLSKLDSELLVVSPVPVQLMELMHSCAKIFEPELRSSEITMSLHLDKSVEEEEVSWIMLDPNRLSQILINLITNAIKFTRNSKTRRIDINISVHTELPRQHPGLDYVPPRFKEARRKQSFVHAVKPQLDGKLYLQIDVVDSGKGLTPEEKRLLFKRFAQGSPKTEVSYGGSGLGLFISRQITEMLGGEIGVGSSPTGGCIFAFYVATTKIDAPHDLKNIPKPISSPAIRAADIPMSLAPESPKKVLTKSRLAKQPGGDETRKALVVEDNLVNQKVLCKQLRNRGFEVEATNHGKEALEALERAKLSKDKTRMFDVCLCDIEMPVMNGIECVREVRRLETIGHFTRIPIIGVTANVRSKQVDDALEAGMDGITTKPYRIDDLIAHIDRLCPVIRAM